MALGSLDASTVESCSPDVPGVLVISVSQVSTTALRRIPDSILSCLSHDSTSLAELLLFRCRSERLQSLM